LEAILKRLNNIIAGLQVSPMEAINTVVKYDSQKHRAIDSEHIEEGQPVIIFERGFLIRDNNGKLRLLKPAMVKKQI
jgi:molecular chaperone GrpE (heat shock protein)